MPHALAAGLVRLLAVLVLLGLCGCAGHAGAAAYQPKRAEQTPVFGYKILNRYRHDPQAFTQGLVFHEGSLYEGTGLYGQSSLREVELESGEVKRSIRLPGQVFGEGVTIWQDRIIQLTWRARLGFVFDLETFKFEKQFRYASEGWGLTHDGRHLIMSDGSANLHFLNPETFAVEKVMQVFDDGIPVGQLNELEYVDGAIYANVWKSDMLVKISPANGAVLAWIDLSGLGRGAGARHADNVLNGIAYDVEAGRLFVTGKRWNTLFEIEVIESTP
jgi:glutamine cyclotransferase